MDVFGLPIPDAGPVFLLTLALHVAAGLTCVATGAVAAFSGKGSRRHRRAGQIYLWALGVVFATMAVMSLIRWRENAHLFTVGCLAFACGLTGYLLRRRRPVWHIAGMGLSYIGLLTGFYVDNGPHLPLWNQLPPLALWLLPALIGLPILTRSIFVWSIRGGPRPHPAPRRNRNRCAAPSPDNPRKNNDTDGFLDRWRCG